MKNGYYQREFGILLLCVSIVLFFYATSNSDSDIPDDNLSYPVLLMSKDGSGSGFFYNKEDATYLITARHVLFKETVVHIPIQFSVPKSLRHKLSISKNKLNKEFILTFYGVMSQEEKAELTKAVQAADNFKLKQAIEELYEKSQKLILRNDKIILLSMNDSRSGVKGINEIEVNLTKLLENEHIRYHPSRDVAYIRIGIPQKIAGQDRAEFLGGVTRKRGAGFTGVGKDNFKLLKDVYVGNQVFVFGYPTSISSINPWLDIGLPLLRKGIIAGINNELKAIILDCLAFQGNSGGLVIEVEKTSTDTKFRAIGVITNLIPYQQNWIQNSGYSVVVPMDYVEELVAIGASSSPIDKGKTNAK